MQLTFVNSLTLYLLVILYINTPTIVSGSFFDKRGFGLLLRRLESNATPSAALTTVSCALENNVDYVGNDISNSPSSTAEGCCGICRSTNGCHAFSWSDYQGGTCWLKSGKGGTASKQGVKSAVVSSQPSCTIIDNTDFVDNDIASAPSADAGGCCDICRRTANCRAFSWSNLNGGTCWLKSGKGSTIYKPGVKSSEVRTGSTCGIEKGVDYLGNDIANRPASKPEDCCGLCWSWGQQCKAFSWTNHNGGTCWLKSAKGTVVNNPNVQSGAVRPNDQCNIEHGVDYVDHDIGNAPSSNAYGCCSICRARAGCKAFSWTNYNGGTCWLKSAKGSVVSNPSVKSAVV